MISVPVFLIAVLVAFVAGGVVDHFVEQKVRAAVAAKLGSLANDIKGA